MKCPFCQKTEIQKHGNSKWCKPCSLLVRKKPVGQLTKDQEKIVMSLKGTMRVIDLAEHIGSSRSNLIRWASARKMSLDSHRYKKADVIKVCEYYAVHGKSKTVKKYTSVNVRAIVERYYASLGYAPRQQRWKSEQIIELAKMAGLISFEKQAEYFDRPRANAGSIKSAWSKDMGLKQMNINGLSQVTSKGYVSKACPYITTTFWDHSRGPRKVALWVDVEKYINKDVPEHLKDAVKALANFQRWLHGRNVRRNIQKMMEQRA